LAPGAGGRAVLKNLLHVEPGHRGRVGTGDDATNIFEYGSVSHGKTAAGTLPSAPAQIDSKKSSDTRDPNKPPRWNIRSL